MDHPSQDAWITADTTLKYKVRLGLWTNWSRGSTLGRTLTMSRRDGDLLIAFTAFLVAFVGSRFWRIVCFSFHRYYSTAKPQMQNPIYQQRQVILRNSSSADSGLLRIIQLYFAWKHSARLLQILPVLFMAAFCLAGFAIAGGFSSQISTAVGTEVLLDGTNCGRIAYSTSAEGIYLSGVPYYSNLVKNALDYVQRCYSANSTGLIDCKSFVVERLSGYSNSTANCPFADGVCRSNSSNLLLDTGYINSHDHLGINAPPDQRILYRQTLHCAPLRTEGHHAQISRSGGNWTRYNYGPIITEVFSADNETVLDYTYSTRSVESQYDHGGTKSSITGDFIVQ